MLCSLSLSLSFSSFLSFLSSDFLLSVLEELEEVEPSLLSTSFASLFPELLNLTSWDTSSPLSLFITKYAEVATPPRITAEIRAPNIIFFFLLSNGLSSFFILIYLIIKQKKLKKELFKLF